MEVWLWNVIPAVVPHLEDPPWTFARQTPWAFLVKQGLWDSFNLLQMGSTELWPGLSHVISAVFFYFKTRVQGTFAYLPSLGYIEAPFTLKASYARNMFPIPVQLTRHTRQFWIRSQMNTLRESRQRLLVMLTCSESCVRLIACSTHPSLERMR